ncbi:hypothetical protein NQZ68_005311 [Dissostichus eleginoides]|nr:hypothetical protein NQZ68_005311 [Dissostichus eleginoides]
MEQYMSKAEAQDPLEMEKDRRELLGGNCAIDRAESHVGEITLVYSEIKREGRGGENTGQGPDSGSDRSAAGALGSRDLRVWPLPSTLRMSSSIFIDPLRLMSPATGRIKLQRSHTSQGEREAGRVRQRMSDAEEERQKRHGELRRQNTEGEWFEKKEQITGRAHPDMLANLGKHAGKLERTQGGEVE